MKKTILIFIFYLILNPGKISAQGDTATLVTKIWTLEDCINYAIENNIGLKRQKLQTESAETDLLKAKMNLIPSLNFGSDANLGFGRSINPVTNLITFKQNISNSYSLNSSIQLFSGFAAANTISANKFMLKAGLETEKIETNTLVVEILMAYYQVLYAKGLEDAAKMQLDLSEKQLFRIKKMVETGKEALSKEYEMESRASEDRLLYTIARNSTSQQVTSLKQLLQLAPGTKFDLMMPDLDSTLITDEIYDIDSVYNIASQILPRLKAINFELEATKKQVAAARGGFAPRLSVGGAIYTGYYKVISEDEVIEQDPFKEQLKNNNSQAIYASLNIPIFNNYTAGRNLNLAKLRRNDAELRLELEKNTLYTEIENICLDYNRGKDEYIAATSNSEFNRKSFEAVEKKFETGLIDVTDYSAAQTSLFRAETETLRTKLLLLIKRLSIKLYSTGEYQEIISTQTY
jgi:outer membrane protein